MKLPQLKVVKTNMENLTLVQVAGGLVFILSLIGNIKSIIKEFRTPIDKMVEEAIDKALKPIKEEIAANGKKLEDLKKDSEKSKLDFIKADLVNLLCIAEKDKLTYEQNKLVHELFDSYTKAGGNSYVHDKLEKLKKEGKI